MKKISLKALLAGGTVHCVLDQVLSALPVIYVLLPLHDEDMNIVRLGEIFLAAIEGTARLPYLQMLASLVSALIAGYVAARSAGKNALLHGCLAALPYSAWKTYRLMTNADILVSTTDIALIAAAFLCALAGGWLAKLRDHAMAGSRNP